VAKPSMMAARLLLHSATKYQLHLSPITIDTPWCEAAVYATWATAVLTTWPCSICLQLTINTCTTATDRYCDHRPSASAAVVSVSVVQ